MMVTPYDMVSWHELQHLQAHAATSLAAHEGVSWYLMSYDIPFHVAVMCWHSASCELVSWHMMQRLIILSYAIIVPTWYVT